MNVATSNLTSYCGAVDGQSEVNPGNTQRGYGLAKALKTENTNSYFRIFTFVKPVTSSAQLSGLLRRGNQSPADGRCKSFGSKRRRNELHPCVEVSQPCAVENRENCNCRLLDTAVPGSAASRIASRSDGCEWHHWLR